MQSAKIVTFSKQTVHNVKLDFYFLDLTMVRVAQRAQARLILCKIELITNALIHAKII